MNGRVYDYNLGRFLSVDPFIQEPGNSQSMNPYSYIMNNPLAGTDPSGYTGQGFTQTKSIISVNNSKEQNIARDNKLFNKMGGALSNGAKNTPMSGAAKAQIDTTKIEGRTNTNEKTPGVSDNNTPPTSTNDALGFDGKPLTTYPSSLVIPDGEERSSYIDEDIIYKNDLDFLVGSNWRSSLSLSGNLPSFDESFGDLNITKTSNLRIGKPISFGANLDVDVSNLSIDVEIYQRVRVDVVTKNSHTIWKAKSTSTGEVLHGRYDNPPKYITKRTRLPEKYIRYKTNRGRPIGTMSLPLPSPSLRIK
jgi:hypothetical protein